jgi:hypothetical protein
MSAVFVTISSPAERGSVCSNKPDREAQRLLPDKAIHEAYQYLGCVILAVLTFLIW